jgi:hypothetical protein
MFAALISNLLVLVMGGNLSVRCALEGSPNNPVTTAPNESWIIDCSTYPPYPGATISSAGSFTYMPLCGQSSNMIMPFNFSDPANPDYDGVYNSSVSVQWTCTELKSNFDSVLNEATTNVGKSPTFWALFAFALSGGIMVGAVTYAVNSLMNFIEGGEKDA